VRARLRRFPGIRSRSNTELGVYAGLGLDLVVSLLLACTEPAAFRHPPGTLLEGLAGVGSAIVVAYSVSVSTLFRDLPRSRDTEWFLGFIVGLGLSGVLAIGLALALLEVSEPLSWFGHLGLYWAGTSTLFLAVVVATLPIFTYDRARARHFSPDE
jgi:hypothetical protein